MSKKIEFNDAGFRAILRSPEVQADLVARAERIAAAAGEGFDVATKVGKRRVRASVGTGSLEAVHAEAVDKVLTSAIDAGR